MIVQSHRATAHALQSDGRTQALQDVLLLQAAADPQQHMCCEEGLISICKDLARCA
jgi:hypothetical protein